MKAWQLALLVSQWLCGCAANEHTKARNLFIPPFADSSLLKSLVRKV